MCVYVGLCLYVYMNASMYVCLYHVCVYVCVCVRAHARACVYGCMYFMHSHRRIYGGARTHARTPPPYFCRLRLFLIKTFFQLTIKSWILVPDARKTLTCTLIFIFIFPAPLAFTWGGRYAPFLKFLDPPLCVCACVCVCMYVCMYVGR